MEYIHIYIGRHELLDGGCNDGSSIVPVPTLLCDEALLGAGRIGAGLNMLEELSTGPLW